MSETKFTQGPWRWEVNPKSRSVELGSRNGMGDIVMSFYRWGMSSATPAFSIDGILRNAVEFSKAEAGREHHQDWHRVVDHPDAHLIAAAPDLYAAAEFDSRLDALTAFDNEVYGNMETWDGYFEEKWEKAEELFPDVAAQFPMPTEDDVQEWSGSDDSAIGVRESKYWEDFTEVLNSMKCAMRDAALAKARGEEGQ